MKIDRFFDIVTTTMQKLETIRLRTQARDIFCLGIFTEQLGPPKFPLPVCPPACADIEFEISDSLQWRNGDVPKQICVGFTPACRCLRNQPRRSAHVTRMTFWFLHIETLSPLGAVHGDCFASRMPKRSVESIQAGCQPS